MTFEVAADAYDRFMGRYSVQLSPQLADFAGVCAGQRVVDVGCGPGALTGELVRRVGAERVSAVDPSDAFVAAAAARCPESTYVMRRRRTFPSPTTRSRRRSRSSSCIS